MQQGTKTSIIRLQPSKVRCLYNFGKQFATVFTVKHDTIVSK